MESCWFLGKDKNLFLIILVNYIIVVLNINLLLIFFLRRVNIGYIVYIR